MKQNERRHWMPTPRRGDMLLFYNAEEIKRQATVQLARIIVAGLSIGLLVALGVSLWARN